MARPPEPPSVPDIPPLPLTITDLDSSGAGVAHHEGLTVHVAQALPHEQVTARLLHTSQHRRADGTRDAWAELVTISVPSPDRVETVCPAYGRCGGCVLQHFSPSAQGEWKRARVETALAKVLRLAPGAPSVAPCVPSPHAVAYRNQAKYVVGRNAEGRIVLGAYAPRSHDLVDLAGCRLGEEPQDVIAAFLRDWIETHAVRPYDERTRTGLLRYVVIRTNGKGRALVTLITARREFAEGGALANDLLAAFPGVVGVVQNVNDTAGNALFGDDERRLAGEDNIDETFGDVDVALSSRAFAQLNREVARAAYREIRAALLNASGGRRFSRLVDVHSGVGAIAFSLADLADEIVAIEVNSSATAAGAAAGVRSNKTHVRFVNQDAAVALDEITMTDALVLNPPRAGAGARVCAAIARLRPQVIAYLSCDPETLARDLEHLLKTPGIFTIVSIQPFDMLPHTPHVETLVVLRASA